MAPRLQGIFFATLTTAFSLTCHLFSVSIICRPMSSFLEFDVYRKAIGGPPYIKQCVAVEETDLQLSMFEFIRNKINLIKGEGTFVYLDSEIVHLKTDSGRNFGKELLHRTVEQFQKMLLDHSRNTWSIEVRIAPQNTMGRGDGDANAGISLLVSKCNEKSFLQSKHSIDHVESFLKGYDECTTKTEKVRYCKELGDQCISLDKQIDTVICTHLQECQLGFYPADRTVEQELVNATRRLKNILSMIRLRMPCISVNNASTIKSVTISCIVALFLFQVSLFQVIAALAQICSGLTLP